MGQTAQQEYFDSLVGKNINDRFRLESKLGAGAMGAVFKAVALETNQTVAIKVISPNLVSNETFIKRFEREGELGKLLKHPNIVGVEEFGQSSNNLFYIAMEFVPGETLKAYLERSVPLSPSRCLELLTPLCNALDFAHKHSVLHRDLKPENILVTRNEQQQEVLKLADFGIAKRTDLSKTKDQMLTVEGEIFGTPHYMSPEQVLAQKLKPTSDVYSIGVMLYQMLSGKLPLEHPRAQQLLVLKVSQDIPPVSTTFPFISPIFDPVFQKVLSRAPMDRYQSAGELLEAFREAAEAVSSGIKIPPKKVEEKPATTLETPVSNKRDSVKITPQNPTKLPQKLLSASQKISPQEFANSSKQHSSEPSKTPKSNNDPISVPANGQSPVIFIVIGVVILVILVVVIVMFVK